MDRKITANHPGLRVYVKSPQRELPQNVYTIANLIAGTPATQNDNLKSFYENSLHLIGISRPGTPVNESDIILSTSNETPNVEDYFLMPFKPKEGKLKCRAIQNNVSHPLVVTSENLKPKPTMARNVDEYLTLPPSSKGEPKPLPFQCDLPPLVPLTDNKTIKIKTPPVKLTSTQRKDMPNKIRIVQIKRNNLTNAQNIFRSSYQRRHPLAVNLLHKQNPNLTQQIRSLIPTKRPSASANETINLINNLIENNKIVLKSAQPSVDMPLLDDVQIVPRDNNLTDLPRDAHTVVQNFKEGTKPATVLSISTDSSRDLSASLFNERIKISNNLNANTKLQAPILIDPNLEPKVSTVLSTDSTGNLLTSVPCFNDSNEGPKTAAILNTPTDVSSDIDTAIPILCDTNKGTNVSTILSTPRDSSRDLHTPVPNFDNTQEGDGIAPKDIMSALDDILGEVKLVDSKANKDKMPPVVYPTFEDTIENLYLEKVDENEAPEVSPRKRKHSEGEDTAAEFTEITNVDTTSIKSTSNSTIAVLENNNKYATDRMTQLTGAQMAKIKEAISKVDNLQQGQVIEPTFDESTNTRFVYRVVTPKDLKITGRNTISISNSFKKNSNSEEPAAKIAKRNTKRGPKKNTDRVIIKKDEQKENTDNVIEQNNGTDAAVEEKEKKEVNKFPKKETDVIVTRCGRMIKTPKQMQLPIKEKKKEVWCSKTKENYLPCVTCPKEFRSLLLLQRHYELNPTHMPTNTHTNLFSCLRNIIEAATPDNKCFVFLHQLESFIKKLKFLLPCFLKKFEGGEDEHYCKINEDVGSLLGIPAGNYKVNINGLNCVKLHDGDCAHTCRDFRFKKDETKRGVGGVKKRKSSSTIELKSDVSPQKLKKNNSNQVRNCPELTQLQIDLDNLAKSETLPVEEKRKKSNNLLLQQLHSKSGIIGYATNSSNEKQDELKPSCNGADKFNNVKIPESKNETIAEKVAKELLNSSETNDISKKNNSNLVPSNTKQIILPNLEEISSKKEETISSTSKNEDSEHINKERNSENDSDLHINKNHQSQQPEFDHEEIIAEIIRSTRKNGEILPFNTEDYNNVEKNLEYLFSGASHLDGDDPLVESVQQNVTSNRQNAEKCEDFNAEITANNDLAESNYENITGNREKAEKRHVLNLKNITNELLIKSTYENVVANEKQAENNHVVNVKKSCQKAPSVEEKSEKNQNSNVENIAVALLAKSTCQIVSCNEEKAIEDQILNVKNAAEELLIESVYDNVMGNEEEAGKYEDLNVENAVNELLVESVFDNVTSDVEETKKSDELILLNKTNEHLAEIACENVTNNTEISVKSDNLNAINTDNKLLGESICDKDVENVEKTEMREDLNLKNTTNKLLTELGLINNDELNQTSDIIGRDLVETFEISVTENENINVENICNEELKSNIPKTVENSLPKDTSENNTEQGENSNKINDTNDNYKELLAEFGIIFNEESNYESDVGFTKNIELSSSVAKNVETAGDEEQISKGFVTGVYENNEIKNLNSTRYEELLYFSGMVDDSSPKNDILSYGKAQITPNEKLISNTSECSIGNVKKTFGNVEENETNTGNQELTSLNGITSNRSLLASEHTYENTTAAVNTDTEELLPDSGASPILQAQNLHENIKSCKEDHMYLSTGADGNSPHVNLQTLSPDNSNKNQDYLSASSVGDLAFENIETLSLEGLNENIIKSDGEDDIFYISTDGIDGDCPLENIEILPLGSLTENITEINAKDHMYIPPGTSSNSSLANIEGLKENIAKSANKDHTYLSRGIVDDSYLNRIEIIPLETLRENIIRSSDEDHTYSSTNTIAESSLKTLDLDSIDGNVKETGNEEKICLSAGITGDSSLENVEILPSESIYEMLKNSGNEEIIYLSGILGNPSLENVEIVPFETIHYDNVNGKEVISVVIDDSSNNDKDKNKRKIRSKKTIAFSHTIGESSTENVDISISKRIPKQGKKSSKEVMHLNAETGVFESLLPQNIQTDSPNESTHVNDSSDTTLASQVDSPNESAHDNDLDNTTLVSPIDSPNGSAKTSDSDDPTLFSQPEFITFNPSVNFKTSAESEALFDFVRNSSPINIESNCNVNNSKTVNLSSDSEDDTQDTTINEETNNQHGHKKLKRVELVSECNSVVGKFSPDIVQISLCKNNCESANNNNNIVEEIILSDSDNDVNETPSNNDVEIISQNKNSKKSKHKEIIIIDITADSPSDNNNSTVEHTTSSNIVPEDDLMGITDNVIAVNNEISTPDLDELPVFSEFTSREDELLPNENLI